MVSVLSFNAGCEAVFPMEIPALQTEHENIVLSHEILRKTNLSWGREIGHMKVNRKQYMKWYIVPQCIISIKKKSHTKCHLNW